MRVFIIACLTAAVIATLGVVVLDHYQKPAEVGYATDSVRL